MSSSSLKRLLLATAVAAAAVASLPAQASFNSIVFFGDSLSDTGNVWWASGKTQPLAPYFQGTSGFPVASTGGQWSDYLGPSWPTVFAAKYGLLASPSIVGGSNFAWGGARTGVNPSSGGVPWLEQQVDQYLTAMPAPSAMTLHAVMIGGNDVANNLGNPAAITNGVGSIIGSLTDLYNAGGRQFLVANVPDVGDTPLFRSLGAPTAAGATAFTMAWNSALGTALNGLSLPDASIGFLDLFALGKDPANLVGLDNTTDACFSNGIVCQDPTKYFYWDAFHPTSRTHAVIANAAALAVPEPETYLLFAVGLAALAWRSRKRAR
jgi:phospholipase/lecithinase/hemolysin